jgi:hypothetical protein
MGGVVGDKSPDGRDVRGWAYRVLVMRQTEVSRALCSGEVRLCSLVKSTTARSRIKVKISSPGATEACRGQRESLALLPHFYRRVRPPSARPQIGRAGSVSECGVAAGV